MNKLTDVIISNDDYEARLKRRAQVKLSKSKLSPNINDKDKLIRKTIKGKINAE